MTVDDPFTRNSCTVSYMLPEEFAGLDVRVKFQFGSSSFARTSSNRAGYNETNLASDWDRRFANKSGDITVQLVVNYAVKASTTCTIQN